MTGPLLDVLAMLRAADARGEDLHGWQIMKDTKRSGPTIYGVLDRLEDLGWITGRWEALEPDESRPRRRLYRLTDEGRSEAREVLAARRPQGATPGEPVRQDPLRAPRGTIAPDGAQ